MDESALVEYFLTRWLRYSPGERRTLLRAWPELTFLLEERVRLAVGSLAGDWPAGPLTSALIVGFDRYADDGGDLVVLTVGDAILATSSARGEAFGPIMRWGAFEPRIRIAAEFPIPLAWNAFEPEFERQLHGLADWIRTEFRYDRASYPEEALPAVPVLAESRMSASPAETLVRRFSQGWRPGKAIPDWRDETGGTRSG